MNRSPAHVVDKPERRPRNDLWFIEQRTAGMSRRSGTNATSRGREREVLDEAVENSSPIVRPSSRRATRRAPADPAQLARRRPPAACPVVAVAGTT